MINRLKELLFQNRSTKQTIIKNTFWLSLSQVGSRLIRSIIIIYAARILGAAEYGVFSYALGLAGFFTIFADIGVLQILTREASQKPEKKSHYFATSFWIKSILLFGTAILVSTVAPYFSKIEGAKQLIPYVALLVIFDGIRELALAFYRALEKMEFEALITMIMNLSITIFGFIILAYSQTSSALMAIYVASVGIGTLTSVITLRKEFLKIFSHFDPTLIKPIVKNAIPVALLGILGVFMLNTDYIMLGWWRSPIELGFYSAGQKIIQVIYSMPSIIASAIFPALAKFIGQKNDNGVKILMEKGMTIILGISIPITVGGIILGAPIIEFLYGKEYLPATLSFQILLSTIVLLFPNMLLTNMIFAHNQQKKLAWFIGTGALANIVFNSLLIPKFGIAGSSIATFIAQFANNYLTWQAAKKLNDFKTIANIKKITVSAIAMGILCFIFNYFGLNVLINIAISSIIYFLILFLLKEKLVEEVRSLFKLAKISPQ